MALLRLSSIRYAFVSDPSFPFCGRWACGSGTRTHALPQAHTQDRAWAHTLTRLYMVTHIHEDRTHDLFIHVSFRQRQIAELLSPIAELLSPSPSLHLSPYPSISPAQPQSPTTTPPPSPHTLTPPPHTPTSESIPAPLQEPPPPASSDSPAPPQSHPRPPHTPPSSTTTPHSHLRVHPSPTLLSRRQRGHLAKLRPACHQGGPLQGTASGPLHGCAFVPSSRYTRAHTGNLDSARFGGNAV